MSAALDRVERAVQASGRKIDARRPDSFRTSCPAHDGGNASVTVRVVNDRVVFHCYSKLCDHDAITEAFGLTWPELFDDFDEVAGRRPGAPDAVGQPTGDRLSLDARRQPGKGPRTDAQRPTHPATPGDECQCGRSVQRFEYVDASGARNRVVHRSDCRTGQHPKRVWQSDVKGAPVLFNLARVLDAVAASRPVWLVEGETSALALSEQGEVATTAPMGASNFAQVDATPLAGADVRAVVDRDPAGDGWAAQVAATLARVGARVEFWQSATTGHGDDMVDHLAAGHALDALVPYSPREVAAEQDVATPPGQPADVASPPEDDPDAPDLGALFVDVAALLAGDAPEPPQRTALRRTDGEALLYAGQVNNLFGDPESGKTWLAHAGAAEALQTGLRVVIFDLDHNGPAATVSRLLALGAPVDRLRDPDAFRYVEPEDRVHLLACVNACRPWCPDYAVVDSAGELLPIMRLSSNSPDDFTEAHLRVLKPLAMAGATVVLIDHLAKNTESRQMGPTGTTAKRRAIGGVSLRVKVDEPFTPGVGGRAVLTVNKDRHGGVRAVCEAPDGAGEVFAGTFVLDSSGVQMSWAIHAPAGRVGSNRTSADLAALLKLDPAPSSVRDVKRRMDWGSNRAAAAWKAYCERSSTPGNAPALGITASGSGPAVPPLPSSGVGSEERPDKGKCPSVPSTRGTVAERSPESTHRGRNAGTPTCPDCGEPLTSPGLVARCRPRHEPRAAA